MKRRIPRQVLSFLVLAACVALDQFTKQIATETLKGRPDISLLGGVLRIVYAENPGAFLGLGGSLGEAARFWGLVVGVGVVLVAALVYLIKQGGTLPLPHVWGIGLLIAGGGSNWFDRLTNDGRVVDFLILGVGPLRTGVFNVADLAIVAGVILMVLTPKPKDPKAVAASKA